MTLEFFLNSLVIGSGYSELTNTQTKQNELYVEEKIGIGTTEPQASLDVNGDVRIQNQNVDLVNVNEIGEVEHKRTKTDVVAETLRPYVDNKPQGLIYLSFEDPENLGKDFSSNGWDGIVEGDVSYVSNVEDSNGVIMKHVVRIQSGGEANRINLDAFADNDFIRTVSFWFRVNEEASADLFHLGKYFSNETNNRWRFNWTLLLRNDGGLRNTMRIGGSEIQGETITPSGVSFSDGNWHFLIATMGGPNSGRLWVDGVQYGPTLLNSEVGPDAIPDRQRMSLYVSPTILGSPPQPAFVDYAEFTLWYDQMEDEQEHKLIQNSYKLGRNFAFQYKTRDNGAITLGDDDDLRITHDGDDSRITNRTGDLIIKSDETRIDGDLNVNGKLNLQDDLDITGKIKIDNELEIEHDGVNGKITNNTGDLIIQSNEVKIDGDLDIPLNKTLTSDFINTTRLQVIQRLTLPKFSTTARDALTNVSSGNVIYNITTNELQVYDGNNWTGGGFQPFTPGGDIVQNSLTDLTSFQGAFQEDEVYTVPGYNDTEFSKYYGGVLANNGKIYCIPVNSDKILIIDSLTDTFDFITDWQPSSGIGWEGGVLATNGKIYGVPAFSDKVLIINLYSNTVEFINLPSNLQDSGFFKWRGGCLAPNGKIYCCPNGSDKILVIDPITSTVEGLQLPTIIPSHVSKFQGVCISKKEGNLVFVLSTLSSNQPPIVLKLDPTDNSMITSDWSVLSNTGGVPLQADNKIFSGGVLLDDSRILFVPFNEESVWFINPGDGESAGNLPLGNIKQTEGWLSGVLATNNKVYCAPYDSDKILKINLRDQTQQFSATLEHLTISSLVSQSISNKFSGAVVAPNNRVYFIPNRSPKILVVNTGLSVFKYDYMLKAHFNKV